jgi:TetR/AcrR family transcriptional regulator, cholesterol catabolism regulator
MAVTKRMSSEDRREQILECAMKVFAEHGLIGARTRDIAKECGINEALLYNHFKSKEELFIQSMVRLGNKLHEIWRKEAAAAPNGLEAIHAVLKSVIETLNANPNICANLLHAAASSTHSEKIRELSSGWFNEQGELWRSLLIKGVNDGSLRSDLEIDRSVMFLRSALWMGVIEISLKIDEGSASQLQHVLHIVDIYWQQKSPDNSICEI